MTGPGYPVIIPEIVISRLGRYFRVTAEDVLSRKTPAWGGKSAISYVADGDGTWDDVLLHFDRLFSYEAP